MAHHASIRKSLKLLATRSEEELCEEIRFYDYIEIQPLQDAAWMVDRGKYESLDDIQRIYERIIKCAKKEGKLIVATGMSIS